MNNRISALIFAACLSLFGLLTSVKADIAVIPFDPVTPITHTNTIYWIIGFGLVGVVIVAVITVVIIFLLKSKSKK